MLRCTMFWRAVASRGACGLGLPLALGLLLLGTATGAAGDPLHTVGAKQCAECHGSEVRVWKRTSHYKHARTLTRSPEAKRIAKAVGVRRMRSDERCTSCHFTVTQTQGRRPRTSGGVSCESCHGSARNWVGVHGNYGSAGATRSTESAAHRKQRIQASDRAGMHRAKDLYDLTSACYACHVVDDEKLVNAGGHPTGSEIDFVAYTQGEMLHNFVRGARNENQASDASRQRQMYVVSRVIELEYALRALAGATRSGPYAKRHAARVKQAVADLRKIQKRAPSKELAALIQTARRVRPGSKHRKATLAAASQAQKAARALAKPGRAREMAGVRHLLARPSARAER